MVSADVVAPVGQNAIPRERRRGRDWRGWKFMWPFAVVFVFVFVVPVVYAVWISLFRSRMV
ncbi:MAG: sugar ABC transporter permease, partial [Bifidobacterium sp.]|nr:sugar ABC transporter permease [Bifidobacterium sp.]MCI1865176.1 sugar ABC transporter permease [Bifidobacterium sp.]